MGFKYVDDVFVFLGNCFYVFVGLNIVIVIRYVFKFFYIVFIVEGNSIEFLVFRVNCVCYKVMFYFFLYNKF